MALNEENKNRRSDLLRRKRLLENEQRLQSKSANAVERIKKKQSTRSMRNLFNFKPKERTEISNAQSTPDQFLNTRTDVNKVERKKIKVGWRVISGLLALLLSVILVSAWQSPDYKVGNITVLGNQRITQEEIINSLKITGTPVFLVNPGLIQTMLEDAFPELNQIKVEVSLPNQVEISVGERQPLITWNVNDQLLWIDSEGYVLPVRGVSGETLTIKSYALPNFYYPSQDGEEAFTIEKSYLRLNDWTELSNSMKWYSYHRKIDPSLLKAIIDLNAVIPYEKMLLFDPHRGLGWNDQRGWKIFVGFDVEHIGEKWLMYEKIVSELSSRSIQPTLISVEYLHAPYYRMD